MKKYFSIVCFFFCAMLFANAQTAPDAEKLLAAAKGKFVQVNILDSIQRALVYFEVHPITGVNKKVIFDTYKAVANGYAENFHFKQGYLLYQKYLSIKENELLNEKANSLKKMNRQFSEKEKLDAAEVTNLQERVTGLQKENNRLELRKSFYQKSFLVIFTILVVFLITYSIRSGIRIKNLNEEIASTREKLKQNHRIVILGHLKKGIRLALEANEKKMKESISLLQQWIQSHAISGNEKKQSALSSLQELGKMIN